MKGRPILYVFCLVEKHKVLIPNSRIYVIELKYDGKAETAIRQIEEKRYARPYQTDCRKLFKIGVDFSSKTRCIENWIIVEN